MDNEPRVDPSDLPEIVEKKSRISIVWLIPVIAAAIGGWLLYKSIRDAGVPITITFETAEGIEAGKTAIKYKEVDVGLVEAIEVSDDMSHVILKATMSPGAEPFLREATRFWVVRPRVTTQGISGLGTLLSGAHIIVEPGEGAAQREFEGLETPPALKIDAPGSEFVLHASELGSVGVGAPIYYRGIYAGDILSWEFTPEFIDIRIFINAPYDQYVFRETQFWDTSGIDVSLDSEGMKVKTASLEALLVGGVSFETPERVKTPTPVKADDIFQLHPNFEETDQFFVKKRNYVMYFDESVRGLSEGAPVEFRGMQLGEVSDIAVELDLDQGEFWIPVTVTLEPERIFDDEASTSEAYDRMERLVSLGLRARLSTGSLITGQLYVELVMDAEAPLNLSGQTHQHPEVPTLPSPGLEAVEKSVTDTLAKIQQALEKIQGLPLDQLVQNTADTVASVRDLVGSPEVRTAITTTTAALQDIRQLAATANDSVQPIASSAKILTDEVQVLTERATKVLASVETMLAPDSAIQHELSSAIGELTGAARAIRILMTSLERHPESILKGKPGNE